MKVLYEDNHIIVVNKAAGEIVQGDKTGDESLCDTASRLKEKPIPYPIKNSSIRVVLDFINYTLRLLFVRILNNKRQFHSVIHQ